MVTAAPSFTCPAPKDQLHVEAARIVSLSPQTIYRWLKDPEFAAACDEAGQAILGQALARLQQASGAAVTILLKVMHDSNAPRSTRLPCRAPATRRGLDKFILSRRNMLRLVSVFSWVDRSL
jgi:hypothetical protein